MLTTFSLKSTEYGFIVKIYLSILTVLHVPGKCCIDNTGVNVAGGAILIGGKTVFSRPLFNNSYSLVQVPGVAGVRVNVNSIEVGRTNAHGDLIVTNLQPYYANSIGVNLNDVPIDNRI